jgi:ABC-2 type transport system ATP-binding protein
VSVVVIRNLTKTYGSVTALQDVTLEVPEGVTGLLGPNGAGKSTMLLCVLGLLGSWSGEVSVLGLDARRQRRALRRRVGFMPEMEARLPDTTALKAVRYLGRLTGLPPSEALRRAHEVLWHVGLGEAAYRDLREYSAGMGQRFKLAQALVHDPEILFLDEPLAGMDPAGRDELLDLVRDLADRHGKHVLWSSHILPEVQKVADTVVILHEGRFGGSFRLEDLHPEGRRYTLEVEGDPAPLLRVLAEAGIDEPEEAAGTAVGVGRSVFTLTLPETQGVADVLRLSRLAGVRVRRAAPLDEDLEAVFHRMLGRREPAEEAVS